MFFFQANHDIASFVHSQDYIDFQMVNDLLILYFTIVVHIELIFIHLLNRWDQENTLDRIVLIDYLFVEKFHEHTDRINRLFVNYDVINTKGL